MIAVKFTVIFLIITGAFSSETILKESKLQTLDDNDPLAKNLPCPVAEDIEPCVCVFDDFNNMDLDCSAADDHNVLEDVFSICPLRFPFTHFRSLIIDHTPDQNLTELTPETFCILSFQDVEIVGTKITKITEDVFSLSHTTLTSLILNNNMLDDFIFDALSQYSVLVKLELASNQLTVLPQVRSNSLEIFTFSGNMLSQIGDNPFAEALNLQQIYMNSNGLTTLSTDMFNLANIQLISLQDNAIQNLEAGAFPSVGTSIIQLDLAENIIETVDAGAITGLAPGALVYFDGNNLQDIFEDIWNPVFEQLEGTGSIDFSDNPLTCGCDMEWLVDSRTYMGQVNSRSTCYSGEPQLVDLPRGAFDYHCS